MLTTSFLVNANLDILPRTLIVITMGLLHPTAGLTSAVNDWLIQHPTLWRLVKMLDWAANHPIISFVVFLFVLTLVWSIIKAIMGLIEKASWSILQVPLKLIQAVLKLGFLSLIQVLRIVIKKSSQPQLVNEKAVLIADATQVKQQRLAEISLRLQAIQQEQQTLLQEATDLINTDNLDVNLNIPELISTTHSMQIYQTSSQYQKEAEQ